MSFGRIIRLGEDGRPDAVLTPAGVTEEGRDEAWLRDLLFTHPAALPAADVDPAFRDAEPICRELRTPSGRIDALFVTPTGALVVVECKLWRNPQARREVVAQILDYAKDLAAWRYEDLQRAVSQALGRPGENALFAAVAARHPALREAEFIDRVARNLAGGRFLLMIVGDGIKEGTESIARYVASHAGLHFTLALVEVAAYRSDGGLLVQPRVLARTVNIERAVVRIEGSATLLPNDAIAAEEDEPAPAPGRGRTFPEERKQADRQFWQDFRQRLRLDDPSVPPPRTGYGRAHLDMGSTAGHLTVFSARSENRIGIFVRFRGEAGRRLFEALAADRVAIDREILEQLGMPPDWQGSDEAGTVAAGIVHEGPWQAEKEAENLAWLLRAANVFVNVFRPRILGLETEWRHAV